MGWPMGLEPTTTGSTTLDSTFELRPPLILACPTRLELVTPSLEGWCSIRLSYGQSARRLPTKLQRFWSGREDLNRPHPAPYSGALPDCATPRKRRQMILLAHSPGNAVCLRRGGVSGTKAPHFFKAVHAMAVELTRKSFTPYAAKKGEEYMNAQQRKHFRKILEALKAELSQEIDRTVHTMQDEATVFADPNDRASQESDMALELRNRDRERKLIKKIDETIARIDANEYGYCDSCGVEIGLKRLEARPTATLCIDCKTLDELRERQVAK